VTAALERLAMLPTSLEIYLTTACNLECSYCSSRRWMREGAQRITLERLTRAVDLFLAYAGPEAARLAGGDPSPLRTIGLTGGEPLLEFELLSRAIRYIRRRSDRLAVDVATNGTLLDRAKAAFLLDRGVDVTVSMDGDALTTDRHRRFRGGGGGKVSERILRNLERLPRDQRAGLGVMTTFTSETVGRAVEAVESLRGFGFKEIVLDLDMYEIWDRPKLARLREALSRLRAYYVREMGRSPWPHPSGKLFGFAFENKLGAARPFPPPPSFSLSPDGAFYPSDLLGTGPIAGKDYRIGDVERGIDFRKLGRVYAELSAHLRALRCERWVLPPVERYFYALSTGRDPRRMMRGDPAVARVFLEELGPFVDIETALASAARERSFGDFDHPPRRRCSREVRSLLLGVDPSPRRPSLGRLRELVDYVLYSPGKDKELVLRGRFDGPARTLSIYAQLKALRLGKSLRVAVEGGIPDQDARRVVRDWDIFLGVRGAREPSRPRFLRCP